MTRRYCPQCEAVLEIQSQPIVVGRCSRCNWQGGPDNFLSEFKPPMNPEKSRWTPYVAIDLETTGLDETYCQVLEFGAVIDDWHTPIEELPRFQRYVKPHDIIDGQSYIYGQPYALALNAEIIRRLVSSDPADNLITCSEEALGLHFAEWLQDHNLNPAHVTAAGKNFSSFDLQFLKQVFGFMDYIHFQHRAIDPAVFYWRPDIDETLPDTKTCLERAGLDGRVAHTAIEDCISVIQLIRRGVRKCQLSASGKRST